MESQVKSLLGKLEQNQANSVDRETGYHSRLRLDAVAREMDLDDGSGPYKLSVQSDCLQGAQIPYFCIHDPVSKNDTDTVMVLEMIGEVPASAEELDGEELQLMGGEVVRTDEKRRSVQ